MSDMVSILDGNAFVVSDRRGDVEATPTDTTGLFLNDTRFLSRWVLTVNGKRPNVLSIDDLAYYRVHFFQALSTGTIYVDSALSCVRQRSVGGGFHEDITLWNHGKEPIDFEMKIEADCDFADHGPHRHSPARTADAGDRLGSCELQSAQIHAGHGQSPGKEPGRRHGFPQAGDHHQRSDDVGGSKEGRELGARDQLHVAQGRAFGLGVPSREARRFTARKPGRNHALIAIWCFVHPPVVPRPRAN